MFEPRHPLGYDRLVYVPLLVAGANMEPLLVKNYQAAAAMR
jgi:hypothetical protein